MEVKPVPLDIIAPKGPNIFGRVIVDDDELEEIKGKITHFYIDPLSVNDKVCGYTVVAEYDGAGFRVHRDTREDACYELMKRIVYYEFAKQKYSPQKFQTWKAEQWFPHIPKTSPA